MPSDPSRSLRKDAQVPVINLSYDMRSRPSDPHGTPRLQVATLAARTARWPGVVLPEADVLGMRVFPVVELTGASYRVHAGVGPQRCLTTLAIWESFGPDRVPTQHGAPPSPVRVVGFVSLAARWERALRDLQAVAGLGAGMVVRTRHPSPLQLMDADASGVWVVVDRRAEVSLSVTGRAGPVQTAQRVPATRLMEEGLFAHALNCRAVGTGV